MGKAEQSESKAKAAEDAKTPSSCTRAGDNHGPMSLIRPYKADGAFLGPSWPISSSFGSLFGPSWGHLGPCKGILGHLGAILEPSWDILAETVFVYERSEGLAVLLMILLRCQREKKAA